MSDRTAGTLIDAAYRKCGITDPSTQQNANGLQDLQDMLSSWSAEGLMVPYYTTEIFTLTIGKAIYTIGSGGDFNTVRPNRIISAFIRIGSDFPVRKMSKKVYRGLTTKDIENRPARMYYDPQYPAAKISFDYEADVAYAFHLLSEKVLVNPTALNITFSLPLEYNEAIIYNLAPRLAADNDIALPKDVLDIAKTSKDTIENMNSNDKLKDPVSMDSALLRRNW